MLRKKVANNASVSIKTGKEEPVVIQNGSSVDLIDKIEPSKETQKQTVGMSLGGTFNLGSYQSLRVDVWLSDTVKDNETVDKAYDRLLNVLSLKLEEVRMAYEE